MMLRDLIIGGAIGFLAATFAILGSELIYGWVA
jgi:hypothetical protein